MTKWAAYVTIDDNELILPKVEITKSFINFTYINMMGDYDSKDGEDFFTKDEINRLTLFHFIRNGFPYILYLPNNIDIVYKWIAFTSFYETKKITVSRRHKNFIIYWDNYPKETLVPKNVIKFLNEMEKPKKTFNSKNKYVFISKGKSE